MQAYDINEAGVSSIILKEEPMAKNARLGPNGPFAVVTGRKAVYNDEEGIVELLQVFYGGKEIGIRSRFDEVQSQLLSYNPGDIIRFTLNTKGEVDVVSTVIDIDGKSPVTELKDTGSGAEVIFPGTPGIPWDFDIFHEPQVYGSRGGTFQRQDRVVFAAILGVSGNRYKATPSIGELIAGSDDIIIEYQEVINRPIVVYNFASDKARVGTMNDLANNVYYQRADSRIVFLTHMGTVTGIIVYER